MAAGTAAVAASIAKDFLKAYGGKITGLGKAVKQSLSANPTLKNIASGSPEVARQALGNLPLVGGVARSVPLGLAQPIARALPSTAGLLTSGGAVAGTLYGMKLGEGILNPKEPKVIPYGHQQYIPGQSPYTNQEVAAMIMDQRKFEQQMQLIAARQAAAAGAGSLSGGFNFDMMRLADQVLQTPTY